MKKLNPIIEAVAKHYGFSIVFDADLEKWIIQDTLNLNIGFYWFGIHDLESFLNDVKIFFKELGEWNCRKSY